MWTELLSGDNRLYILGKYFIRRSDDAYSPIYRKSEEALYEWICDMAVKFGKGRVEIEHASSYGKRLKSARSVFDMLNQAMKSEGKHGLICIDGLDEFVLDAPYMFEAFCSYFAGIYFPRIYNRLSPLSNSVHTVLPVPFLPFTMIIPFTAPSIISDLIADLG